MYAMAQGSIYTKIHPADIAEKLIELPTEERTLAFLRLSKDKKTAVFSFLDVADQHEILENIGDKGLREIIENMAPDDRTQLFSDFPDDLIRKMIRFVKPEDRKEALALLGYEPDSIGRLMTPHFIKARPEWTVRKVLKQIKTYGEKAETLNFVYIVDEQNKLIDDLRIGQLLMADEDTVLSSLMDHSFVSITSTQSLEKGLKIFEKYEREALPIISEDGILVGIVTFDDIMDKITDRDTEDIQRFGGSEGLDLSYTDTNLFTMVKKRSGWLVILFIGEMFTASAMAHFESEIEAATVLALFVPLIISSGGNSGSQAASLIIRSLALKEVLLKDWLYVLRKEFITGLLLGAILGLIGFVRITIWESAGIYDYGEHWVYIAFTIGISLVAIVLWGSLAGSLIPFALRRLGMDPATASAPFVATLVDVTGLFIYFTVAMIMLSGKLL